METDKSLQASLFSPFKRWLGAGWLASRLIEKIHLLFLDAAMVHAGDSRVYHFRGPDMMMRTKDHSYVQRLVDEGKLTEDEAANHPKSNLLTGCLGSQKEPPVATQTLDDLKVGDALMTCSDGVWHYFTPHEMASAIQSMSPREATAWLIDRARERAHGGGDNLSIALIRIDPKV